MTALISDLRHAVRGIGKQPGFSALVIGVLGVGLACVIFMFALLDGFLLRPLPFAHPQQLLQAGFHGDGGFGDVFPVNSQDVIGIRDHLHNESDVAAVARSTVNLSDLDQPERLNGGHVSANLFHVLGVAPILGRDFIDADEQPGSGPTVMLSYAVWQRRYGADPGIVGKQVRVDARAATVIGVMPKNFSYPRSETIWLPATLSEGAKADDHAYWVVLRRHAGISTVAITNAFKNWFLDAARVEPERFRNQSPQIEPLARMTIDRTTRGALRLLVAAVIMVLLVACANAANLLLTRTLGRSQELSVRAALGASRQRLVVHLLTESVLLSLIATAVALLLAYFGVEWQQGLMRQSESFPHWLHFDIDARVVLFAFGAAMLTALATGVMAALSAGDMAVAQSLRAGSRSVGGNGFARISRILVVGEIALSCALLICVGTLVRGISALDTVDLGIDTSHLLTARIALMSNGYPSAADQRHLYERLAARLREDAGVVDATIGTALPGTYYNMAHDVLPDGILPHDAALPQVYSGAVDGHFLNAYGVQLKQGRFFDGRDSVDSPRVAVVDQKFVARYGEGKSVLGREFRLDPRDPHGTRVSIVGVVNKLTLDTPGYAEQPAMLVPLSQEMFRIASIAVRTGGDALSFAPRLDAIAREVAPDAPLYWVRDYPAVIGSMTLGERALARSFGTFGFIALMLAAVGLYGVMAFAVAQRTREIGVRRALGASTAQVLRKLFGRSLAQLGVGLTIGCIAGIAFAYLLTRSLQSIQTIDATVVLGALAVLAAAAVVAMIVPAHRALRIDPMVALRDE